MINSLDHVKYLSDLLLNKPNPAETLSLESVFALAKANGLLLATGTLLGDDKTPAAFQERLAREKLLEKNTSRFMNQVLNAFSEKAFPLLSIKSFLPYPYVDSNIDLVAIDAEAIEAYRDVIRALGFRRHRNLADIREPYKEMYYHLEHGRQERSYPRLHLHRSISWNGVVYLDPQQAWQRHTEYQLGEIRIAIPSPEDEVLIMAAHAMFENKYITLGELLYLRWLTQQGLNWDYIIQTAKNRFWLKALNVFLSFAQSLGQALDLDLSIEISLAPTKKIEPISYPYVMSHRQTLGPALSKMGQDISHGRLKDFPRQLFTYFLVDPFWMYRKAYRKAEISKPN